MILNVDFKQRLYIHIYIRKYIRHKGISIYIYIYKGAIIYIYIYNKMKHLVHPDCFFCHLPCHWAGNNLSVNIYIYIYI